MRDYVIHPEYYKGGLFNDVALLFLSHPVEIVENVNTVCLPNQGEIFDGSRCFASGWGLWLTISCVCGSHRSIFDKF